MEVLSLREAAKRLGIYDTTVCDVVRTRKMPTLPISTNAKAKGLTPAQFRELERIFSPPKKRGKAAQTEAAE